MGRLDGQVVVITGGGGFLGTQHCEAVREEGGIAVSIDRHASKAAETTIFADIADRESVIRAYEAIVRSHGHIDALVNNAARNPHVGPGGMASDGRFETLSPVEWAASLRDGLTGAFYCSQVFGGHMASMGHGVIVNIASELGLVAPNQSLYHPQAKPVGYVVEKHGLIGLTRYLAAYWGDKGVRVNALAFGGMENGQSAEFIAKRSKLIPMGRMAQRGEYKSALIFALTSTYMTGSVISVDGGYTCW